MPTSWASAKVKGKNIGRVVNAQYTAAVIVIIITINVMISWSQPTCNATVATATPTLSSPSPTAQLGGEPPFLNAPWP